MPQYHTCPECGANLDPGERCSCRREQHDPHCYMAVSPDKYELPLVLADSAKELAARCGVSANTVYTSIAHEHRGAKRGMKFVRVGL